MYPHLAKNDGPMDSLDQIDAALAKLQSESSHARAYRDQSIYDLWTLSELMTDPDCCQTLMRKAALPALAKFLALDNSAGVFIDLEYHLLPPRTAE